MNESEKIYKELINIWGICNSKNSSILACASEKTYRHSWIRICSVGSSSKCVRSISSDANYNSSISPTGNLIWKYIIYCSLYSINRNEEQLFPWIIQFQNSTFNVSKSTLEVMKEEFRLSLSICEEIIAGKVNIN